MTSLQALAERLEKADGPDRELDAAIMHAFDSSAVYYVGVAADGSNRVLDIYPHGTPPLSASLDAAIALCERVLPDNMRWSISNAAVKPRANVFPLSPTRPIMGPYSSAATPALALCLAIVRARIAEEAE